MCITGKSKEIVRRMRLYLSMLVLVAAVVIAVLQTNVDCFDDTVAHI